MGKKGVSPLIAAVFLIAFTMGVAAVLTAWVQGLAEEQKAGAQENLRCASAILAANIDYAKIDINDNLLQVLVESRGKGSGDIPITHLEIWADDYVGPKRYAVDAPPAIPEGGSKLLTFDLSNVPVASVKNILRINFLTPCKDLKPSVTKPSFGWRTDDLSPTGALSIS